MELRLTYLRGHNYYVSNWYQDLCSLPLLIKIFSTAKFYMFNNITQILKFERMRAKNKEDRVIS